MATIKCMTRRSQLELDLKMPVRWGGARDGAGRKAASRAAGMASRASGVSGEPSRPGDDSRSQRRAVAADGPSGSRGGALAPRDREARGLPCRSLLAPARSRPPARRIGGRRGSVEGDEEPGRAPRSGRESRLRAAGCGARRPLSPPRARHAPRGASRASLRAPQRAKACGPASPSCPELRFLRRSRVLGPLVRGMGRALRFRPPIARGCPSRRPGCCARAGGGMGSSAATKFRVERGATATSDLAAPRRNQVAVTEIATCEASG